MSTAELLFHVANPLSSLNSIVYILYNIIFTLRIHFSFQKYFGSLACVTV